jgi:hypothetical protein
LLSVPQPYTGATAVLVDELDTYRLESSPDCQIISRC